MPNLNLKYGVLIYEDASDKSPKIKMPDIENLIVGVGVDSDKSDRITIYPNEIKDIAVTSRALGWDATTELHFERHITGSDSMRIKFTGTGAAPNFRTKRAIGGSATTTVTITRVTPYVARIQNVGGTAWNLATVQVNDLLKLEKTTDTFTSPFTEVNQLYDPWLVQAKGADYIDFIDNGICSLDAGIVLGADYDFALRVMSQGPVKIGDTIELSGAGLNPSNVGKFSILDVSPEYLEIVHPLGVDEIVLIGSSTLTVYEYLIGFVHMRASSPLKVRFGNQTEWVKLDRIGAQAILLSSLSTHSIQAYNDSSEIVTASVQYAKVL